MIEIKLQEDVSDLKIENNDFNIISDSKALRQQLAVFLNIRGDIDGELEFDVNNGIDYTMLINRQVKYDKMRNYLMDKIMTFYSDYILKINSMTISKEEMKLNINFQYVTIWGEHESLGGVIS